MRPRTYFSHSCSTTASASRSAVRRARGPLFWNRAVWFLSTRAHPRPTRRVVRGLPLDLLASSFGRGALVRRLLLVAVGTLPRTLLHGLLLHGLLLSTQRLVVRHHALVIETEIVGDAANDVRATFHADDLHVDRVAGELQEFELAHPILLALHRVVHTLHDDLLVATEHSGHRQHDHVVERFEHRTHDVAIDGSSDVLECLRRVAHEHREPRRRATGTADFLVARHVTRDRRNIVSHRRELFVDGHQLLRVRVGLEEIDRL